MTTIRIKKLADGSWIYVDLLKIGVGRVKVDDGLGPLWVEMEHLHPNDRAAITAGTLVVNKKQ